MGASQVVAVFSRHAKYASNKLARLVGQFFFPKPVQFKRASWAHGFMSSSSIWLTKKKLGRIKWSITEKTLSDWLIHWNHAELPKMTDSFVRLPWTFLSFSFTAFIFVIFLFYLFIAKITLSEWIRLRLWEFWLPLFYGRDFIFLSKIVACAQEIKAPWGAKTCSILWFETSETGRKIWPSWRCPSLVPEL